MEVNVLNIKGEDTGKKVALNELSSESLQMITLSIWM